MESLDKKPEVIFRILPYCDVFDAQRWDAISTGIESTFGEPGFDFVDSLFTSGVVASFQTLREIFDVLCGPEYDLVDDDNWKGVPVAVKMDDTWHRYVLYRNGCHEYAGEVVINAD